MQKQYYFYLFGEKSGGFGGARGRGPKPPQPPWPPIGLKANLAASLWKKNTLRGIFLFKYFKFGVSTFCLYTLYPLRSFRKKKPSRS